MLGILAIVAAVVLAAILGFAATRPGTFRVERSKSIEAPPARIFELINDFHRWAAWSPWEKLDPAMKRTFAGAPSGKGAVYEWAGNSKAGEGRMEITGTSPGSKVTIKLDFLKPFEAHNTAEFTLVPAGAFTKCDVGDVRTAKVHHEGYVSVRQHGQTGGQGFRGRPGQY